MKLNNKEIAISVIIAVSLILLVLDIFGVIDFHIPGWILKQVGRLL